MLTFLKNHPFAVECRFETSLVLTYAVPKEELERLIPECLCVDSFKDRWGFVAVAMVQTKGLRPKGFPRILGNDFILVGYRIFVQYRTSQGKRLRGLYIIGSETDKTKMAVLGNIFTHYNYRSTDIRFVKEKDTTKIHSSCSRLSVVVREGDDAIGLPKLSPFRDWKEARRFAGPLPFTFTYQADTKKVLIIEGVREDWIPKPVHVIEHRISFIDDMQLNQVTLANAFVIHDIPYYWKRGRKDIWKPL